MAPLLGGAAGRMIKPNIDVISSSSLTAYFWLIVIHPLHVLQDLLEMIWYVPTCHEPWEGAFPAAFCALDNAVKYLPACVCVLIYFFDLVSLASYYYGTRKSLLIASFTM